eukprot:GEZU01029253.1.p1 GENE.GEZU01029253.1~~GEZU01029253.1.p1  ORF type:complete len:544 (-),score=158.02 GEZU01029253.1:128-1759(-)
MTDQHLSIHSQPSPTLSATNQADHSNGHHPHHHDAITITPPDLNISNNNSTKQNINNTPLTSPDAASASNGKPTVSYANYIRTDELLSLQNAAVKGGLHHHDEHLFITVHQSFEIWFKQILWELTSVRDLLCGDLKSIIGATVPESEEAATSHMRNKGDNITHVDLSSYDNEFVRRTFNSPITQEQAEVAVHRLNRADKILRLTLEGFDVMETMHPGDFLEFRDHIGPASGFQSLQMREMEVLMGLADECRITSGKHDYKSAFSGESLRILQQRQQETSLKQAIYKWLEEFKVPEDFVQVFINAKRENLLYQRRVWKIDPETLQRAVDEELARLESFMNGEDYMEVQPSSTLPPCQRPRSASKADVMNPLEAPVCPHLASLEQQEKPERILNHGRHHHRSRSNSLDSAGSSDSSLEELTEDEKLREMERTSKIRVAALFIQSYRHHPLLARYAQLLDAVIAIEEAHLLWRARHVRMVERMIGRRIGTGGSSGVDYLEKTLSYRIFIHLWGVRTMLVKSSTLPPLESLLHHHTEQANHHNQNGH